MIAAYFLKAHGHAKHGEGWLMNLYLGVLHWTLRHRWVTVAAGFASLVGRVARTRKLRPASLMVFSAAVRSFPIMSGTRVSELRSDR